MIATAGGVQPSSLEALAPGLVAQILRECGEARIRVAGTSMLPSIRPADVLHIRTVDIARVQREDVILFERDARLFAHRVVRAEWHGGERMLTTRGDMHSHDDPPVTEAQLLGRVEGQARNGRVVSGSAPWGLRPRPQSGLWFECRCAMRLWGQAIRSLRAAYD